MLGQRGGDNWGVLSPCPQSYTFLISSDYERAEWRENIREQQKKCEWPPGWGGGSRRGFRGIGTVVSDLVFPSGLGRGIHPSEVRRGALTQETPEEGCPERTPCPP